MRILLLNPRHGAIGSRLAGEHLPPLGLLALGGPLLNAGHTVTLVDADLEDFSEARTVAAVAAWQPELILVGHSGSTSAHPTIVRLARALGERLPGVGLVYGGVYPTYHWDEILDTCPDIDIIVRGEGEETIVSLVAALEGRRPLASVRGIAYREEAGRVVTPPALPVNLDEHPIAWELIDHARYTYWGGRRAVVVQFSRGCPHPCNYCGQRGFWTTWRHRDPVRFARELARLHREAGVTLINFADELPTFDREAWRAFLEALVAEKVDLTLVGSTRADDIVRDADLLDLYRRAGVVRFLLGIETYDPVTRKAIRKGGSMEKDAAAIALLRGAGILSMATCVLGFKEETDRDFWQAFLALVRYDPDQIQLLHATPHRWTPFYDQVADRPVVDADLSHFDYKHQILAARNLPPWRVMLWFKGIEAALQLRPRVVARMLFHPSAEYLHGMAWYTRIGRRVWLHEVAEFIVQRLPSRPLGRLRDLLGPSLAYREYALRRPGYGEQPGIPLAPRRPPSPLPRTVPLPTPVL